MGMALIKEKEKKKTVANKKRKAVILFAKWVGEEDGKVPEEEIDTDYPDYDISDTKTYEIF